MAVIQIIINTRLQQSTLRIVAFNSDSKARYSTAKLCTRVNSTIQRIAYHTVQNTSAKRKTHHTVKGITAMHITSYSIASVIMYIPECGIRHSTIQLISVHGSAEYSAYQPTYSIL